MSIFKCKMCGGTIEFEQGATVGVCDSCGTKQTLPRLDDDRRANLYDRANHFRRNNEFDKAMGIYEQILNEDTTDAEAYWSIVLCRYGIEYVEDPQSHKRIPTVNRAQFTSIFADEDYKSALQYADGYQRQIYEEEAKAIDDIQKGILEISSKEEPFDVFICYKETDANGRRTPDSVLAQDLYHQLTQEGFKVFFSRITLEDKLGSAYEPYIFAALNSAKVMVVLGTKPEYFNAVWVKNEWSRYLALVKQSGGKKSLIPAYRDMDPYDLPEEFSHLQAQDMSKLGFMQDLIRGIGKLVHTEEKKTVEQKTVVVNASSGSVAPLLERAFMFLDDKKWDEADTYAEKVLDQDPKNGKAYLVKLLAGLCVRNLEDLANVSFFEYEDKAEYKKVIGFDEETATTLARYREEEQERLYVQALEIEEKANTAGVCRQAESTFEKLGDYRDAPQHAQSCRERAEMLEQQEEWERVYRQATGMMRNAKHANEYSVAAAKFSQILNWRDAKQLASRCRLLQRQCEKKQKFCIIALVAVVLLAAIIIPCSVYNYTHSPAGYLEYKEDGDTVTITGTDYDRREYIPADFEIPTKIHGKSVTSIGSSAFNRCTGLTSVTIPNSVTSIDQDAFEGCTGLKSVTIPDSVTSIGHSAFEGCTGLTSVTIPNSVTSIGWGVFNGCTGLKSVTIPGSVTSIGSSVFEGCTGLKSVTISSGVTSIGLCAFSGCTNLTSVTIPNTVTHIGQSAFKDCAGLTSITIPNRVTDVGFYAFEGCTGLTSVTIPNSVTSIGWGVFKGCTGLKSVTIPNSVTSIKESAFEGCKSLPSVTIPSSVTEIGDRAFLGCGLTHISLSEGLEYIGSNAFSYNDLTSVVIPASVKEIRTCAFGTFSGKQLSSITFCNTVGWKQAWGEEGSFFSSVDVTDPTKNAECLDSYYVYKRVIE